MAGAHSRKPTRSQNSGSRSRFSHSNNICCLSAIAAAASRPPSQRAFKWHLHPPGFSSKRQWHGTREIRAERSPHARRLGKVSHFGSSMGILASPSTQRRHGGGVLRGLNCPPSSQGLVFTMPPILASYRACLPSCLSPGDVPAYIALGGTATTPMCGREMS